MAASFVAINDCSRSPLLNLISAAISFSLKDTIIIAGNYIEYLHITLANNSIISVFLV